MHKFVWENAESLNDNYIVYNEVYKKYCFAKTATLFYKIATSFDPFVQSPGL
jgi:hypothetical protein